MSAAPLTPDDLAAYVRAAGRLQGFALDEAQVARVAAQLALSAGFAALLDDELLAPHDEPAAIYDPSADPTLPPEAAT